MFLFFCVKSYIDISRCILVLILNFYLSNIYYQSKLTKICCKNLRFVLVGCKRWTRYITFFQKNKQTTFKWWFLLLNIKYNYSSSVTHGKFLVHNYFVLCTCVTLGECYFTWIENDQNSLNCTILGNMFEKNLKNK